MSTTPLTDAINALTQYANETTGASDTTLSDAVGTLVAGYGGGGGGFTADDIWQGNVDGTVTMNASLFPKPVSYAFQKITSLSCPNATSLRNTSGGQFPNGAFEANTSLTTVYAPLATGLVDYIFRNCTALTDVNVRSVNDSASSPFAGCTALPVIVLPKINVIYHNAFNGCRSLAAADILGGNYIGQNCFNGCTPLDTFIIRRNGVCTLQNINSFAGTPFASGGTGGTLYVPQAQISSYQSANNWSTILGYANNQIKAIEGSYYETHYADGTVIE